MLKVSLALFSALLLLQRVTNALIPLPPPAGESYYLSKTDILGEELIGGAIILAVEDGCFVCKGSNIVDDSSTYFKDTESFYSNIAEDYNLGAQLKRDFTLGLTLDKTTRSISDTSRSIKGSTLNVLSKFSHCVVKPECLYDEKYQSLNVNFLSDFEALPKDTLVEGKYDFSAYDQFLNKFGSHVVTGITYGSQMYQHCFSTSEQNYNSRNYTVRACVAFSGGTDVTKTNISTCAGITQDEVQASSSLDVSTRLVIRGGNAETRAQLYAERTSELIAKFLSELSTNEPIQYSFTPLWTLLGQKYIGTEHYAKVRHLEGYYLGYLNFDCQTLYSKETKYVMQGFAETASSTEDVPTYMCYLPAEGCHVDDDCDYSMKYYCQCKGDTCFKDETRILNTGEQRTYVISKEDSGKFYVGCSTASFHICFCKNSKIGDKRAIWQQDQDRADGGEMLRNLHYKLRSAGSACSGSSSPKNKSSKKEL